MTLTADNCFIPPDDLARAIRESRDAGRATDELGTMLWWIAGGVWDAWGYGPDRAEFQADCVAHLIAGPLKKVDPGKRPFAFLTTACRWFGNKVKSKARRRGDRVQTVTEVGTDLTERAAAPDSAESDRHAAAVLELLADPARRIADAGEAEAAAAAVEAIDGAGDPTPAMAAARDRLAALLTDYTGE